MNKEQYGDYKRARNRFILAVILFMLVPIVTLPPSIYLVHSTTPAMVFAVAAMAWAFLATWQFIKWPCPRCGEVFARILGPFGRKCAHCGFSKPQRNA